MAGWILIHGRNPVGLPIGFIPASVYLVGCDRTATHGVNLSVGKFSHVTHNSPPVVGFSLMHTTRGDMACMQPAHNPAASDEFLAGVRHAAKRPLSHNHRAASNSSSDYVEPIFGW